MRPLNAKQIEKILLQNGFIQSRQRGSHTIFTHRETHRIVILAAHNRNKTLPIGTFLAIIKQSQIDPKKFNL